MIIVRAQIIWCLIAPGSRPVRTYRLEGLVGEQPGNASVGSDGEEVGHPVVLPFMAQSDLHGRKFVVGEVTVGRTSRPSRALSRVLLPRLASPATRTRKRSWRSCALSAAKARRSSSSPRPAPGRADGRFWIRVSSGLVGTTVSLPVGRDRWRRGAAVGGGPLHRPSLHGSRHGRRFPTGGHGTS
jgi:hypothetical protein